MSEHNGRTSKKRPAYADFDSQNKFLAIESIIAKRLVEHPKAICSYSGGSDSDIVVDLIERVRKICPQIEPIKYMFLNTGLEMKAIKDHVWETAEKYGIEIEEVRPKVNIIQATRKSGIPFLNKIVSGRLSNWQRSNVPVSVVQEYNDAEDKPAKYFELKERYPHAASAITFLCSCTGG